MFSFEASDRSHLRAGILFAMPLPFLIAGMVIVFTSNFAGAGSRVRAENVTVIGMDALGKAVGIDIPAAQYRAALTSGLSAVNAAIRPSLKANSQPNTDARVAGQKIWNLRTIGVGVGLRAEFGLGPLFTVTLAPRLRLIFTNSLDPIYPD